MTYTLEALAQESRSLRLDRFDYDVAWRLGLSIRTCAAAASLPVAITIAHGPDLVFSTVLPGATADNLDWAARKRAVAWRFQRSSLAMRLDAERQGHDFNLRYRLPVSDFAASGGGVPLILCGGAVIGTAGVSGLPDTDDHRLVVEALQKLIAEGSAQ